MKRTRVTIECPHCGHRFERPMQGEQARAVYQAVVVDGMSNAEYVRQNGLTHSTVTLYRRCGIALIECGVDEESTLFGYLAGRALANDKTVAAVIEARGTVAQIEAACLRALPAKYRNVR